MPRIIGLDGASCIDATTCTLTSNQANVNKTCTVCSSIEGSDARRQVASVDKTMCINATACTNTAGHYNMSGNCISCISMSKVVNTNGTGCIEVLPRARVPPGRFVDTGNSSCTDCAMTNGLDSMPQVVGLDGVSCIDATTCKRTARQAVVNKECMTCGGLKPITNDRQDRMHFQ